MACFSLSDALAKQIAGMSAVEIAWFRYMFLLVSVMPVALVRPATWKTARPVSELGRALAMVMSAVLFLIGLQLIPIAEATAMSYASPLYVTLLAMALLGEPMTLRRWTPLLLGFAGVVIVVRPGTSSFGGAEVFPLASSMAWAVAVILTRKVSATDSIATTMLYTALIGELVLTVMLPTMDADLVTRASPKLIGMAAAWCIAQWLVVAAYRAAAPSTIAPFSYSQLIWAGLLGYGLFRHVPDVISLVGMAVILSSGLYAAWLTRQSPL